MPRFIALMRGINVGGHNRLPMAELRFRCEELGWRDVQSYIQSGNLLFTARGSSPSLEAAIEKTILDLAGSPVTTRNWRTVLKLEELARSGVREA